MRPYIKYFSSTKTLLDLPSEEICLAMSWSGDYAVASERAAEAGKDITLRNQQRALMRLTKATAEQTCLKCHDLDNSPHFDYSTYWKKIEHSGNKK